MSENDLLAAWSLVIHWCADDLASQGSEGVIFQALGQHSKAATFLAQSAFSSPNYTHRKLAASLAGWIRHPPLDLLEQFFHDEAERDRRMPRGDFDRLNMQSVVEDVVFSATFWARRAHLRAAGLQVLRDIVERTQDGEYWNTASYAMIALCRHEAPGYRETLARFQRFASSATVIHPSRPSMTQERNVAANLAAGNPKTLLAVESVLDQKEKAAALSKLDSNHREALDQLVHAAETFENGTR